MDDNFKAYNEDDYNMDDIDFDVKAKSKSKTRTTNLTQAEPKVQQQQPKKADDGGLDENYDFDDEGGGEEKPPRKNSIIFDVEPKKALSRRISMDRDPIDPEPVKEKEPNKPRDSENYETSDLDDLNMDDGGTPKSGNKKPQQPALGRTSTGGRGGTRLKSPNPNTTSPTFEDEVLFDAGPDGAYNLEDDGETMDPKSMMAPKKRFSSGSLRRSRSRV